MWGYNICGQLGTGDQKTRWEPTKIDLDTNSKPLPQVHKIKCSNNSTYAIDAFGKIYSWGKGFIGHQDQTLENRPKKIELNTDNRVFIDIFSNSKSAIFYAPIRVYSISPSCGPVSGGTLLSIIGTGFVQSEKMRVRFSYGEVSQESHCTFDPDTKTLYCKTPRFDEF